MQHWDIILVDNGSGKFLYVLMSKFGIKCEVNVCNFTVAFLTN
jgi:hypothetical protein